MPEPQNPGGVECHSFDQLSPELKHETLHPDMCWAAPRLYSPNSLQATWRAQGRNIYYKNVARKDPSRHPAHCRSEISSWTSVLSGKNIVDDALSKGRDSWRAPGYPHSDLLWLLYVTGPSRAWKAPVVSKAALLEKMALFESFLGCVQPRGIWNQPASPKHEVVDTFTVCTVCVCVCARVTFL